MLHVSLSTATVVANTLVGSCRVGTIADYRLDLSQKYGTKLM